eukprot:226299_1
MALRRITKELNDFNKDPVYGCSAEPIENDNKLDLFNWKGIMMGPADSPYETGIFHFAVEFPPNYPFSAPKFTFLQKVYHCNVYDNGRLDCDILCSSTNQWSPALTISKVLLVVQELFKNPDAENHCIPSRSKMLTSNKSLYDITANQWTIMYANGTLNYEDRYKMISKCLKNIFIGIAIIIEPIIIEMDGKHLNKLSKKRLKAIENKNNKTKSNVPTINDTIKPTQCINVKTLTGKVIEIYCWLTDTVTVLKSRIYDKEGIPVEQQRIIYQGKQLENETRLNEYNVQYGAMLHLVTRLKSA